MKFFINPLKPRLILAFGYVAFVLASTLTISIFCHLFFPSVLFLQLILSAPFVVIGLECVRQAYHHGRTWTLLPTKILCGFSLLHLFDLTPNAWVAMLIFLVNASLWCAAYFLIKKLLLISPATKSN